MFRPVLQVVFSLKNASNCYNLKMLNILELILKRGQTGRDRHNNDMYLWCILFYHLNEIYAYILLLSFSVLIWLLVMPMTMTQNSTLYYRTCDLGWPAMSQTQLATSLCHLRTGVPEPMLGVACHNEGTQLFTVNCAALDHHSVLSITVTHD